MRPAMVVPAPVFAPPTVPPAAPPVFMPPAPGQPSMMDEDEPASKRSRTEENLVPEGIAVDNTTDTHAMDLGAGSVSEDTKRNILTLMEALTAGGDDEDDGFGDEDGRGGDDDESSS